MFSQQPASFIKRKILINIVTQLLAALSSALSSETCTFQHYTQLSLFLEVMKRADPSLRASILLDKPFPEVTILPDRMIRSESLSTDDHLVLFRQLREELEKRNKEEHGCQRKYEIINEFEGIKKGLFPVDIVIKKDEKIVGFIEVDGPHHYRIDKETGKQKLRRADQLKEFLYHHDYPKVPFIRIDVRKVHDDVHSVSKSILSEIQI
jgi:hypothetical protein